MFQLLSLEYYQMQFALQFACLERSALIQQHLAISLRMSYVSIQDTLIPAVMVQVYYPQKEFPLKQ